MSVTTLQNLPTLVCVRCSSQLFRILVIPDNRVTLNCSKCHALWSLPHEDGSVTLLGESRVEAKNLIA